eukprot:COSAG05_NODE_6346_length_976_cov_3.953250_1_plen_44_part_10
MVVRQTGEGIPLDLVERCVEPLRKNSNNETLGQRVAIVVEVEEK